MSTIIPYERIDAHIKSNYVCSLMCNTKWIKLLNTIADVFDDLVHSEYKTIHGDEIYKHSFYDADDKFFSEPLMYKEVEWIQFPASFQDFINDSNRKAGMKIYSQDVTKILSVVNGLGSFDTLMSNNILRIYAYR